MAPTANGPRGPTGCRRKLEAQEDLSVPRTGEAWAHVDLSPRACRGSGPNRPEPPPRTVVPNLVSCFIQEVCCHTHQFGPISDATFEWPLFDRPRPMRAHGLMRARARLPARMPDMRGHHPNPSCIRSCVDLDAVVRQVSSLMNLVAVPRDASSSVHARGTLRTNRRQCLLAFGSSPSWLTLCER